MCERSRSARGLSSFASGNLAPGAAYAAREGGDGNLVCCGNTVGPFLYGAHQLQPKGDCVDTQQPKYDLAISFLSQDEPVATALHDRLSAGAKVFFYPRNQEELAGTDGMESMRRPFVDDLLVVVVLYRERWGKTPWTRVEDAAIQDGCLKHGWHRLFFMSLDDAAPFPIWLPNTHVRFSYTNFGIEQAAGAIKARVQECGGVIAPVTALSRARLVHAEAEHLKKKERLFGSQEWIQTTVRPAIAQMFAEIVSLAAQISSDLGMSVRSGSSVDTRSAANICSLTNDRVGLSVVWHQPYTNVMGQLEILEIHNGIILPGERKMWLVGVPPTEMVKHVFLPDLSVNQSLCWTDERKSLEHLSTGDLADRAVQMFLDLCQRANRGEIDATSEYFRRIQRASHGLE